MLWRLQCFKQRIVVCVLTLSEVDIVGVREHAIIVND